MPSEQETVLTCKGRADKLPCYFTSGTGNFHLCTCLKNGRRDVDECQKRYNNAAAEKAVAD